MAHPSANGPHRPQSVNEIIAMALKFEFNTNISFKHWARATETLWQEAQFAFRDGDIRRAFMMLFRHSNLVLERLPKHPEAKLLESRRLYKPLAARLPQVIQMMEDVKPEITREYEEWEVMTRDQRDHQSNGPSTQTSRPSYEHFASRDPSLSGNAKILDAADNQDLAVDLAQREFQRRDAAKRATRQAGITEDEERDRRKAGTWDSWTVPQKNGEYIPIEDADFRWQMEAARRQLTSDEQRNDETNRIITGADQHLGTNHYSSISTPNYSYPTIHKSRPVQFDTIPVHELRLPSSQVPPQPPKPPKQHLSYDSQRRYDAAPPIPGKEPPAHYTKPDAESRLPSELPALPPKEELRREAASSAKAPRLTFKPAAYLENGEPIRPIFLPSRLRAAFLEVAQDNTRRGLEMCGILCGTPVNNALFIKCLLIPEQKCTSDTCETENESAMLDYCINEDLLVLGWIHTHPTQTCFMSSRDLHTQAGYQVMMPESIAIVCAPKFEPSYGIFRLTNPPGLPHILQCSHTDTFHQHSIDNIYTECGHPPGHVYETSKMDFQVVDLRPGFKR